MKPQLFLDLDGVLADFDKLAEEILGMPSRQFEDEYGAKEFWYKLRKYDDFFFNLPLMHDAQELWDYAKQHDPIILTGVPFGNWAPPQKVRWVKHHFNTDKIITCLSREKRNHMKAGDVIVDDLEKYKHLWEENDGIFILHTNAKNSIAALKEIYK